MLGTVLSKAPSFCMALRTAAKRCEASGKATRVLGVSEKLTIAWLSLVISLSLIEAMRFMYSRDRASSAGKATESSNVSEVSSETDRESQAFQNNLMAFCEDLNSFKRRS